MSNTTTTIANYKLNLQTTHTPVEGTKSTPDTGLEITTLTIAELYECFINHPETNVFDNLENVIAGNLPRYTRVLKGLLAALETADLVSVQNDAGVETKFYSPEEVKEAFTPLNQFG